MVVPQFVQKVSNVIRNFFSQSRTTPTPLERKKSMSINPQIADRFTGKGLRGGSGEQSRVISNVIPVSFTGPSVIGSGAVGGFRSASLLSSLGRGIGNVAKYLAPSFRPSIIATRGTAYLGGVEAYRLTKALQSDNPNFSAFFPTGTQLASSVGVGIFPPTAFLGGIVGKGQQEAINLGNQFSSVYQSFMPDLQKPKLPSLPNVPDVEIGSQTLPSYTGGSTEISLTTPPSNTVVTVSGGGGGDFTTQAILYALLTGGTLGYLFGHRKRKRKRYKGRRRRK